jgi:23S rRNA pseudouridine1911/1915/1917 synthase
MKRALLVGGDMAGQRVDLFVGQQLDLSRSRLKALFEAGRIRVDGRVVKKGHAVAKGQTVEVEFEEAPAAPVADAALELRVLHEDEALVVVDKPAGVPVQPLTPGETGTVVNALLAKYPEMASVGDDPREAGLCHRLDVETSGVLLAARTRKAWEAMRAAFSGDDRDAVEKRYLALVTGPIADAGEIDVPLTHAGDHVKATLDGSGRPALTRFSVRARRGEYALVDVLLVTGVLHQVRAHLAAIGAPIVGDTRYGGRKEEGLDRVFLHAVSLGLKHPGTGRWLEVEAELPEALARVIDRRLPDRSLEDFAPAAMPDGPAVIPG